MIMRKKLYIFALLGCFACSDNSKEQAQTLLMEAQVAYEKCNYNDAKVLLDSIENNYKQCIDARKAAQLLM